MTGPVAQHGSRSVLVIGVGNPGRGDDGIGPALVDALEADGVAGLTLEAAFQLSLEHAASIAGHSAVMFVDASLDCEPPFSLRPAAPCRDTGFSTHVMAPEAVLEVCRLAFGLVPEAWLLAVRGYDFGPDEGLSEAARDNLARALEAARAFVACELGRAPREPAGSFGGSGDRGLEEGR